jgi:hypothetical protein
MPGPLIPAAVAPAGAADYDRPLAGGQNFRALISPFQGVAAPFPGLGVSGLGKPESWASQITPSRAER